MFQKEFVIGKYAIEKYTVRACFDTDGDDCMDTCVACGILDNTIKHGCFVLAKLKNVMHSNRRSCSASNAGITVGGKLGCRSHFDLRTRTNRS